MCIVSFLFLCLCFCFFFCIGDRGKSKKRVRCSAVVGLWISTFEVLSVV